MLRKIQARFASGRALKVLPVLLVAALVRMGLQNDPPICFQDVLVPRFPSDVDADLSTPALAKAKL